MLGLLLAILAGILLGLLSGLVPGLHPNTISAVLSNLWPQAGAGNEMPFLLLSLAAAATVFESIRAIFFYIPDSTSVLSFLPGHRMLMDGRGMLAIRICALAFLASSLLAFLLLPLSLFAFPLIYSAIAPFVPILLIALCAVLLLSERKPMKILEATFCFALAGLLGLLVFNYPIVREPLFPSFAGLFAISGIAMSMSRGESIPKQRDDAKAPISLLPVIAAGTLLGACADLLPGLSSPAQIATFASIFIYLDTARFLALTSAIASSHLIFSLSALLAIGKARTGAVAIAGSFIDTMTADWAFGLAACTLLATALAVLLVIPISRKIAPALNTIDTTKLNVLVLAYILSLLLIMEGANGLLVAAAASIIGLLPPLLGVRRTHLMGLILLPSILRYF